MRALAHPVRLAILDLLHTEGTANATECAREVGESPQACSYHFRSLAKWGIVRKAGSTDGRETRWELASRGITFSRGERARRGYGAAAAALRATVLERDERIMAEFNAREHELPEEWRKVTILTSIVHATPEELEELGRRVDEVTKELGRRRMTDRPLGARRVDVTFRAIPKVGE
jgi:DNA-binding transcriptional ArsR family regulator